MTEGEFRARGWPGRQPGPPARRCSGQGRLSGPDRSPRGSRDLPLDSGGLGSPGTLGSSLPALPCSLKSWPSLLAQRTPEALFSVWEGSRSAKQ